MGAWTKNCDDSAPGRDNRYSAATNHQRVFEAVATAYVAPWTVQSRWGTQRTYSGVDLVRLEDVHRWMLKSGKPARPAVFEIFGPLLEPLIDQEPSHSRCGEVPPCSLDWCWYLNSQSYPAPVFPRGKLSNDASVQLLKTLPDLEHVRYRSETVGGLMHAMAMGALKVWRGVGDLGLDPVAAHTVSQDLQDEQKYGVEWPNDRTLDSVLGRLAVPHSIAFELWGWTPNTEDHQSADVVALRVVTSISDPKTWTELVAWRKQNKGANWTNDHKRIVRREKNSREGPGIAKAMASALDCSVTRLNELVKRAEEMSKSDKRKLA